MTDNFLRALVETLADRDGSIDVTIATAGATVTGRVVSARAWHEAHAEDSSSKPIADLFRTLINERSGGAGAPLEEDDSKYVHLIEAKILSGGRTIPNEGVLRWRAQIDGVTGWTLGRLG